MFRILRRMKHDVVTEFEITGQGLGDVFDLTTSVQYEIESNSKPSNLRKKAEMYKRDGVEVIVIPLRGMPVGMKEREKELREYVWE